jgi:4-hydroxythreonine-4-phosphate dehydrogenase
VERIAITMGEPGGIGPEVALKAAASTRNVCVPVLVGDAGVFRALRGRLGIDATLREVSSPEEAAPEFVALVDTGRAGGFRVGAPTAEGAVASVNAIRRAVALAMEGRVHALVTSPISKEALKMAGFGWPGHTEMLAELTGAGEYTMMLVGGNLRVILVTIHSSLKDVPALITNESVARTLRLAALAAEMLGIGSPRIAVAGLNPHAGEAGMFGHEENDIIAPAVEAARRGGLPVEGPYPPDTVYFKAARGEFDMVVSMYHDQGLIPLKLLAFESGVNVTVGLPIIRTSPDHGTAYEIAGKGTANPSSTIEAVKLALRLRLPGP